MKEDNDTKTFLFSSTSGLLEVDITVNNFLEPDHEINFIFSTPQSE